MKTRSDLHLRQLGSQFMIVDAASQQDAPTAVHTLNSTAADIWKFAEQNPGFSVDDITRFLTETYDVDAATALADASSLISQWTSQNLIEL